MKAKITQTIVILFALCGCMKEPVSTEQSSNRQVNVELLFENNGVKVYRFFDGGRAIYYTDARGAHRMDDYTQQRQNGNASKTLRGNRGMKPMRPNATAQPRREGGAE